MTRIIIERTAYYIDSMEIVRHDGEINIRRVLTDQYGRNPEVMPGGFPAHLAAEVAVAITKMELV